MSEDDSFLTPFSGILGRLDDVQSKYIVGDSLGKGSFGKVWHVTRRSDEQHFVAKIMQLARMDSNAALRARSEVACLASCDHFACVKYVEDHNVGGTLLIVMEYCDAGDLHYQLKTMRAGNGGVATGFAERDVRLILLQLVLALNHMHRRKMLHRDIKAANVLLSTSGLVKIGDFGLSREFSQATLSGQIAQTFCGTADYLAPEVWKRERYGARADVWSLGILVYECLVGRRPFIGDNLRTKILGDAVQLPQVSPEMTEVLTGMLNKDPAQRMSIRDLLQTKCLTDAITDFTQTVRRTKRLTEEQRAFVLTCLEEVDQTLSGATPTPAPSIAFEGVVGKLKEGRFVDRYLVLKDGLIGIFRDEGASRKSQMTVDNARPMTAVTQVAKVPVTQGTNVVDNVFVIDFGGGENQDNCVWLRSATADEWVGKLRSAMRLT